MQGDECRKGEQFQADSADGDKRCGFAARVCAPHGMTFQHHDRRAL
jgi:hypothetical protein